MEIIDRYIQGSQLTILFAAPLVNDVAVGVDNATSYNKTNNKGKHDAYWTNVVPNGNAVEITIPDDFDALVIVTIYISTVTGDKIYKVMFLNEYMLFKAQQQYLNDRQARCSDCDEKQWRSNTLAMLLRIRLLQYAYENDLLTDAIDHYVDLARILSFDNVPFTSIPFN